eukprot:TRINITY_DN32561_c1_g1_i4.p3 TRINITY_DN32561_c1_g1~~TRINITY_DN32561_c1_g1_i4.p3  ORF type:complete len:149 (-),score=10.07 TRINITY_DN32561_c1_g1_i4:262-708(-)
MINRPRDWVHGLYRHVKGPQGHKLFDLLNKLPDFGLGIKIKKVTWAQDRYLEIVSVKPQKDGKHGSVLAKHILDGETYVIKKVKSPYLPIWLYHEKPKIPQWNVEPNNWQDEILNTLAKQKEEQNLPEQEEQSETESQSENSQEGGKK